MPRSNGKRRIGSGRFCDSSGGKLPPIPMSIALANALEAEATNNLRSPRNQARAILCWYFGLTHSHPNLFGDEMARPVAAGEQTPDICPIDINLALSEIERLSGGDE